MFIRRDDRFIALPLPPGTSAIRTAQRASYVMLWIIYGVIYSAASTPSQ
jgi:hypothetical protein